MLRHLTPIVIEPQYSSDDAEVEAALRKPKRERRLRHTSPSPTRSRFLRIVRRNEDATGAAGKRPPQQHSVKRCHSYHDIEQAAGSGSGRGEVDHSASTSRGDLASMSAAATVSSSGPVGGTKHLLSVEEPRRERKSSGGSHNMFSLGGLRFGGKAKGEKKKKDKKSAGDLPSPDPTTIGDVDVTLYSVPPETLREWRKSLDIVLQHPAGRILFHRHLALEHSLENMQFCKEVDQFKTLPDNKLEKEARAIAAKYVGEGTPKACPWLGVPLVQQAAL
jgi:hypothetical protein